MRHIFMQMKAGIALLMVLIALPSTTRGASSENLKTTCQDSMVMEGKEGQIQFFLRPAINLETDPYVMFFIRKHSTPGDILRCDQNAQQSGLACYAVDHRFRLGELARHQLTLNIANATLDLQGRYELHIVANGVFEPATSCNLTVQRKGVAKPENDNTKSSAVGIGIGVFLAIIAFIIIIVLRKHRNGKRCSKGVTDERKKVGPETSAEITKAGGHAKTVFVSKEQAKNGGFIGNKVINTLGKTSTENKAYQQNSIPTGKEQTIQAEEKENGNEHVDGAVVSKPEDEKISSDGKNSPSTEAQGTSDLQLLRKCQDVWSAIWKTGSQPEVQAQTSQMENVDSTEADVLLESGQQLATAETVNSVTEGAENMSNESRPLICDQQHDQTDDKQRLGSPMGTGKHIEEGVEIAETAEELNPAVQGTETERNSEMSKPPAVWMYTGNKSTKSKNAPRGPFAEHTSKQQTTNSDKQSGCAGTGHTFQGNRGTNTPRLPVSGTSTEAREPSPSVTSVSTGRPNKMITDV